jgi:hypothetical protein
MVQCPCGSLMEVDSIEEAESETVWIGWRCSGCEARMGAEGTPQDFDGILDDVLWTDEANYQLTRLPPYVEPLVREEVIRFARQERLRLISHDRVVTARNKGAVAWSLEAERRLARVPASVRAMAKIELERTALDRHMPEVTVALMEELKSRYFGMAASRA